MRHFEGKTEWADNRVRNDVGKDGAVTRPRDRVRVRLVRETMERSDQAVDGVRGGG